MKEFEESKIFTARSMPEIAPYETAATEDRAVVGPIGGKESKAPRGQGIKKTLLGNLEHFGKMSGKTTPPEFARNFIITRDRVTRYARAELMPRYLERPHQSVDAAIASLNKMEARYGKESPGVVEHFQQEFEDQNEILKEARMWLAKAKNDGVLFADMLVTYVPFCGAFFSAIASHKQSVLAAQGKVFSPLIPYRSAFYGPVITGRIVKGLKKKPERFQIKANNVILFQTADTTIDSAKFDLECTKFLNWVEVNLPQAFESIKHAQFFYRNRGQQGHGTKMPYNG